MKYFFIALILSIFNLISGDYNFQCSDVKGPDTHATFKELGCFTGNENAFVKKYYYPRYFKSQWIDARSICKSYDMKLATFDSIDEVNAVFELIKNNQDTLFRDGFWMFVDAMTPKPGSASSWYWTQTGKQVSFAIPWATSNPSGGHEQCLSIGKHGFGHPLTFNDVPYEGYKSIFLCQKTKSPYSNIDPRFSDY